MPAQKHLNVSAFDNNNLKPQGQMTQILECLSEVAWTKLAKHLGARRVLMNSTTLIMVTCG